MATQELTKEQVNRMYKGRYVDVSKSYDYENGYYKINMLSINILERYTRIQHLGKMLEQNLNIEDKKGLIIRIIISVL